MKDNMNGNQKDSLIKAIRGNDNQGKGDIRLDLTDEVFSNQVVSFFVYPDSGLFIAMSDGSITKMGETTSLDLDSVYKLQKFLNENFPNE